MAEDYQNWLKRAKSNFKIAKITKDDDICYEDLCYEAQQCSEKALKALLIYLKQEIPKVHSFHILLEKLEQHIEIPEEIKDVIERNNYAVQTRYPGDYLSLDKEEYERALEITERVFNWVSRSVGFSVIPE
ncbi:MAG: HEPN domain-containing protein [Spirochaetales bacterium]|nr:HEPN domain-containing protein [Spirochaetales bacterium]